MLKSRGIYRFALTRAVLGRDFKFTATIPSRRLSVHCMLAARDKRQIEVAEMQELARLKAATDRGHSA
jgi:hypothetical protein